MSCATGPLVRARGREWVVLPESEADLLVLRPLSTATLRRTVAKEGCSGA